MGKRAAPRVWGAFVVALERGLLVREAAAQAGISPAAAYARRRRCAAFAAAWDEAVARSTGVLLIEGGNGRMLQRKKVRRTRFSRERKEIFLSHFAATCDAKAATEAAGVCKATLYVHLRNDRIFASAYQEALEIGYRTLEAELLAQQMETLAGYRIEPAADAGAAAADPKSFERSLQLLAQWRRKDGRIGPRDSPRPGRGQRWSFEDALAAVEKGLKQFGALPAGWVKGVGVPSPARELLEGGGPLHHASHGPPPRSGEDQE